MATSFYYTDYFKLGAEAVSKRKHFAKAAKPLRGRSERHGYVILVSNEPRCCNAATSERRRIRLKADYYYIALRGASIRRSQRGNSEAVFFRGTLPRRTASNVRNVAITQRHHSPFPLPLWLRLVPLTYRAWKTARRSATHAHTCRLSRPKVRCGGS